MNTHQTISSGRGVLAGFLVLLGACGPVLADTREVEGPWPLRLAQPPHLIAFYEPTIESFEGEWMTGRAAVSVATRGDEPVFGAVWFRLRVELDDQRQVATVVEFHSEALRFPDTAAVDDHLLATSLAARLPGRRLALAPLLASLARETAELEAAMAGSTAAPKILWTPNPVTVLRVDGPPQLQEMPDAKGVLQVVNADAFIVVYGGQWYLLADDAWFASGDFYGDWKRVGSLPAAVLQAAGQGEGMSSPTTSVPQVVVADRPLEVIETDGSPTYSVIPGTSLLYVVNTASDLFFEIGDQRYYVLLAGRWFGTDSLTGGIWEAVPADELPNDFAAIPPTGVKAEVLAHVPDTEIAHQAVLDAQTPEVRAVDREASAQVVVDYRGEPYFAPIDNLGIYYAVNTAHSVLRVGGDFYLCLDGAWYWSAGAYGPWAVAIRVPTVVYAIPPRYPVYPATYVRIYDWTPTRVYVGYTSGYWGWHVGYARRGLVFGFAYYEPAWHFPRTVYYPPPPRPLVYRSRRVAYRGYRYRPPVRIHTTGRVRLSAQVTIGATHHSTWQSPTRYSGYVSRRQGHISSGARRIGRQASPRMSNAGAERFRPASPEARVSSRSESRAAERLVAVGRGAQSSIGGNASRTRTRLSAPPAAERMPGMRTENGKPSGFRHESGGGSETATRPTVPAPELARVPRRTDTARPARPAAARVIPSGVSLPDRSPIPSSPVTRRLPSPATVREANATTVREFRQRLESATPSSPVRAPVGTAPSSRESRQPPTPATVLQNMSSRLGQTSQPRIAPRVSAPSATDRAAHPRSLQPRIAPRASAPATSGRAANTPSQPAPAIPPSEWPSTRLESFSRRATRRK